MDAVGRKMTLVNPSPVSALLCEVFNKIIDDYQHLKTFEDTKRPTENLCNRFDSVTVNTNELLLLSSYWCLEKISQFEDTAASLTARHIF